MKYFVYIVAVFLFCFASACNKYASLNGEVVLSGYAYIIDSSSTALSLPMALRPIYLNPGDDTGTYIYQVNTDSLGKFYIPSMQNNKKYILFTRFISNNIEYQGSLNISTNNEKNLSAVLNVYPVRRNGLWLIFTDSFGDAVPNVSFRLYTSRSIAIVDSSKYAYINAQSDINGSYVKYNVTPSKYYIVSKDSIPLISLKIFDSITVTPSDIKKRTVAP